LKSLNCNWCIDQFEQNSWPFFDQMVIKIWLTFFNNQDFFQFISLLGLELLDYDKVWIIWHKKSWPFKWWANFSCHLSTIKIFIKIKFFFYFENLIQVLDLTDWIFTFFAIIIVSHHWGKVFTFTWKGISLNKVAPSWP